MGHGLNYHIVLNRLNPTGHMGDPAEIASCVVFLASPRASRVSGTNLVADGALTRGVQL